MHFFWLLAALQNHTIMIQLFIMQMCVFLWIGFVGAISFMEAWLKFKAPGVTLPIGLGIGKLVFNALNKMEWLFAIAIAACFLWTNQPVYTITMWWYGIVVLLLVVQTFWLLPALDARASALIGGQTPSKSLLHWYFVGAELTKVTGLLLLAIALFKSVAI